MRISLFIPSLNGGGAELVFVRLAGRFAELGHEVDLVLMTTERFEYRDELSSSVRIVDLRTPRLWTSLPAFINYLRRRRPDAVLSSMPLANGIAAWACRILRAPARLVLSEHNTISMAFDDVPKARYRPLSWLIRTSYPFADAIISVSKGVADRVKTIPGVSADRVSIVHNPSYIRSMEEARLKPATHPWFDSPSTSVILSAGRLVKQKDFKTLIRAFKIVSTRRDGRLLILGEGEERGNLDALIHELDLQAVISLPGFVRNPYAIMSRASVFVLSSRQEGFGNVLVEAMACGIPVVSTDSPGPVEILAGGRYGPIVPTEDPEALAFAIEQVLDCPTDPELLRNRAREFSVEASADEYLRILSGGNRC